MAYTMKKMLLLLALLACQCTRGQHEPVNVLVIDRIGELSWERELLNTKLQGVESLCGRIEIPSEEIVIEYDAYMLAGEYVNPERYDMHNIQTEQVNGQSMMYVYDEGRLVVTFKGKGKSDGINFICKGIDKQKCREVLALLRSFKRAR